MAILYSSVIKLSTLHAVTLNHLGGQHAHAAFLDIVRAVDAGLAERLHDANARKPFTLSPLMGLPKSFNHEGHQGHEEKRRTSSAVNLRQGWECWLRVAILDDRLFKTFIEHFLRGAVHPEIRLGDAKFLVSEILTTPGSHSWAGYTSIEDLQKRLDEPAPQKFKFELHTPTAFGWRDNFVAPMPTPALVFGNLARAWKELTGEDHVHAVEEYAERNLLFSTFNLRTERTVLHNNTQLGAAGWFEFIRTDKEDSPPARALNLLADLAFYTGLGRKTAQGMGMARRIEDL